MSIDSDVYDVLSGYAGLTSLVSTRVYSQRIAQGASFPAVVYAVTSEPVVDLLGNVLLHQSRVIVTSYAQTTLAAKNVIDQVVLAMTAEGVPYAARSGQSDPDLELDSETVEFDWWT